LNITNLTEIVVRAEDNADDLHKKAEIAAFLGTVQSKLTDFPYLRKIWKKNTEEERLLGVSMTGIYDTPITYTIDTDTALMLETLRDTVVQTNVKWANRLGIPVSTATTCIKPSGTVSQLTNTASGIHPRYAKRYLRTVRSSNNDPMTQFLKEAGIPHEPALGDPENTTVFTFVQEAPEDAKTRHDVSTLDHLKLWLQYQRHWCEHKPSATINVRDGEWIKVGAFVYDNFDEMTGVSFLPYDGGTYKQAPYQEVDKETIEKYTGKMPSELNWSKLSEYELEDSTAGNQSYACSSGSCELVDLT